MPHLLEDIAIIEGISAVPTILDVVCRTTGMGFAAVARVTEDRWIACSVLDNIHFGLKPGGELKVETTICHEIRQTRKAVVIDHVDCDATYRNHPTPRQYGFQSYISMPIFLADGRFFGTLCAIDPQPARVNTPGIIGMFKLFAELIASHIDAAERLAHSESRLLEQREVAELREQFIGVLGHDLRTPLGAISMCTELLAQSALDKDGTATVGMMKRSVSRMSDLVNDAMDFARGRLGGGIPVEVNSEVPVESVLTHVVAEVGASWPNRAIDVEFDLAEGVHYDRKRLAQLFTNLLANALIHGRKEKPATVRAMSRDGRFELSVANAADPIPPAVLARLFEPFSRGGAGNYQQGLGLGLYIASEIAKSHGGALAVTSTEEETRFTFTMPSLGATLAPPLSKSPSGDPAGSGESMPGSATVSPVAGSRILLIEDHADTLTSLTRLLTRRGHTVTSAASGAAARAEFQRGVFDIIVSDLGLPDCSGFELIAELCSARPTPAIALSGFGMDQDIVSSRAAGFTEHLTKPIDFEEFIQAVNRVARKTV